MFGTKFTILGILAVFVITAGFGCRCSIGNNPNSIPNTTLEYWGVWDTPDQISALRDAYQASHPRVTVNYRNFRLEEYEQELLEAWADDRGPDIFAIPVSWLREYQHRIVPMPAAMTVPVLEVRTGIKTETILTQKTFPGYSSNDIRRLFVPIVEENVVIDNQIWGLPYSMDTLVTFYNQDLLTREGVATPIVDFNDLVTQAPQLTRASVNNDIVQSAVSLGGTDNIPNFFDIFSNIMMQNEVKAKGPYFNPLETPDSTERFRQVLGFYTDFARPGRASYSWNEDLPNAADLFANGQLAYFFGYSYHADDFRNRGLSFNWDITNFPQPRGASGTKYYADYWVNVVAKKSAHHEIAWNFIQTTSARDLVKVYLDKNRKPTALRSLIDEQRQEEDLRVFASQVLTADNWYQGYNVNLAEQYFEEQIEGLLSGEYILDNTDQSLRLMISKVNQTYQNPND